MFTSEDLAILEEEANKVFENLPREARFSFIWKKANVTPTGITYASTATWENVPGFFVPPRNTGRFNTSIGYLVQEDNLQVAVPKRFGETVAIDGITYVGGIQIHDMLQTQDGQKYKVTRKERRGYGAYYVLVLEDVKGYSDEWIAGQYP